MNFFEEQDQAKRATNKLVLLFVLAVCTLIFLTVLALHSTFFFSGYYEVGFFTGLLDRIFSLQMLYITLAILFIVAMGSLFKHLQVKKGGTYVAEKLGGRHIYHAIANDKEKMLLNIVEEMSIASGISVPKVYVLEDKSLNAFAAGTNINNSVVAVTQGLLDELNRDELQGVIAHEFSHIYHGDMSINMKLIAVLHGILMIGLLGEFIMRSTFYSRSSRRDARQVMAIGSIGFTLFALGYAGVFFGNLIKSAISRQREYLADASAVQYTRNPQGIGAALYKIGHSSNNSQLNSASAKEFSHFYFCAGAKGFVSGLFATHPAIEDRISKIYPNGYNKELLLGKKTTAKQQQNKPNTQEKSSSQHSYELDPQQSIVALTALGEAIENIGKINPEHLEQAKIQLENIPQSFITACQNPFEAQALIFAFLTDTHEGIKNKQQQYLKPQVTHNLFNSYLSLFEKAKNISNLDKLTIIQLCSTALRQQSDEQFKSFLHHCKHLIQADQQIEIFEWCVFQIIEALYQPNKLKQNLSLHECEQAVKDLFFAIIQDTGLTHQQQAATAGFTSIYPRSEIKLSNHKASALPFLQSSINKIKQLKSLEQPILLKGLAKTIEYDGKLDDNEAQIFRAIGIILDCPMPILKKINK